MGIIVRDNRGNIVVASREQAENFGWTPVTRQDQQVTRGGVARGSVPAYRDSTETKIDRMKQEGVAGVYAEAGKTTIITPNEPQVIREVITTDQRQSIKPEDSLIPQYATGQFEQHPDVIQYRYRRAKESYDNWVRQEQFIEQQTKTRDDRLIDRYAYGIYTLGGTTQVITIVGSLLSGMSWEESFKAGYEIEKQFYRDQVKDKPIVTIGDHSFGSFEAGIGLKAGLMATPFTKIYPVIQSTVMGLGKGALVYGTVKTTSKVMDQGKLNTQDYIDYTGILFGTVGILASEQIGKMLTKTQTKTETFTITRDETVSIVGKETYTYQNYPETQREVKVLYSTDIGNKPANAILVQADQVGGSMRYITDLQGNIISGTIPKGQLYASNVYVGEKGMASLGYVSTGDYYKSYDIATVGDYIIRDTNAVFYDPSGTRVTTVGIRVEADPWDTKLANMKKTNLFGTTRKTPVTPDEIYRAGLFTDMEKTAYIQNKFLGGINVGEYHDTGGSLLIADASTSSGTKIVPASLGITTTTKSINVLATSSFQVEGKQIPIITSKINIDQSQRQRQFTQPQQETKFGTGQYIKLTPINTTTPKFRFSQDQEDKQKQIITPVQINQQITRQLTKSYQDQGFEFAPVNLTSIKFTTRDYKRPPTKPDTTFKFSGMRKGYVSKAKRLRDYGYKRKKITKVTTFLPTADLISMRKSLGRYGKATDVRSKKGVKQFNINLRKAGVFGRFPTKQQYGKKKRKKSLGFKIRGLKL